jgi:sugar phosphate isomerase/epimerase
MSPTVLCSTGVLTREPDRSDHKQILEHGAKLGTTALELLLHEAWYGHLDEVVEDLKGSSFSFPVVHSDKGIGSGLGSDDGDEVENALQRLEVNCRAAAALGAKTLVLHLWELPTDDGEIERNLEQLPACLDTADAYNLALAVETIVGSSGTTLANIRLALERDQRCGVTLDTEFLGFHGQLAESISAEWLWAEKRVRHVHVKDFDGRLRLGGQRRYLLPGEGSLDLRGFLAGLVERGYAGAISVEASALTQSGELDEARLGQIAGVVRELAGS